MRISSILNNRFLRASSVVLAGSFIANVLNYVFNLLMGRLLPPTIYGELVSLITLLLIVGVPALTVTTVLAQYTASHWAKGEHASIARLAEAAMEFSFVVGAIGLGLMFALTPLIASYLKISIAPIIIFDLLLPLSFLSATSSGLLQGLQQFLPISLMNVISASVKFFLSLTLVWAGFSLGGVMAALVIAALLAYGYGILQIRKKITNGKPDGTRVPWKEIFAGKERYIGLTFATTLLLAVFVNIDLIMAKHYLAPAIAGQYAALSVLGKIITYGTGAFLTVLFPMVSASRSAGDGHASKYLGLSLAVVGGAALALVALFSFFPQAITGLLFGNQYVAVSPFLVYFGIAAGFSALSTIFIQFFLASRSHSFIYPLAVCTLAEVVGIAIFHGSIIQIVLSSLATSVLLIIAMVLVYAFYKPAVAVHNLAQNHG